MGRFSCAWEAAQNAPHNTKPIQKDILFMNQYLCAAAIIVPEKNSHRTGDPFGTRTTTLTVRSENDIVSKERAPIISAPVLIIQICAGYFDSRKKAAFPAGRLVVGTAPQVLVPVVSV